MIRQALIALATTLGLLCASGSYAQTITPTNPAPPPPPASWNNTSQQALETAKSGTAVPWQNPDGSTAGAITPSPAFQDASGQTCREFQQTINVNGQPQQAFGTACRQPDGSWNLQPAPAQAAAPVAGGQPPPVAYALPPAYYYPDPFYDPLFFGFGGGCCFGRGHFHGHGGHFHHH